MSALHKLWSSYKKYLAFKLIGGYFTVEEVVDLLSVIQYDLAQNVIRKTDDKTPVIPLDYLEDFKKYKGINPYRKDINSNC